MASPGEVDLLAGVRSAQWLMRQEFEPLQWIVPGIVPEGMTMLNAAPKVGKSWLVLGLALACAEGGLALGALEVEPRPVLYLALEDGHRRLQDRLRSLGVTMPPEGLWFLTDAAQGNVTATIAEFYARNIGRHPLVILDTLGRSRPPTMSSGNQYQLDYAHAARLKATVDPHPGAGLLIVHHTRKGGAADFLDEVSGTQGLAGAADTVAVLRRDREDAEAVLNVTSRDAPEGSYSLNLDESGRWSLVGGSLAAARESAARVRSVSGLGDETARVVEFVSGCPVGVRAADVAEKLEMDSDKAGRYLRRLADAGRIARSGRGLYTPVRSVRLSGSGSETLPTGQPDTSDTPCEECGEPMVHTGDGATTHPTCDPEDR